LSPQPKTGRTQAERASETRKCVLDATVACLLELGFAKTSTVEVQRRAGVSRGALLHHFPSKAGLITDAIGHLTERRGRDIHDRLSELPEGSARIDAVIDILWESFSGPLFCVTLEVRNAARTDEELRPVVVETELAIRERIMRQSKRLFGTEISNRPGFQCALDMTLQIMIGAAATNILHREPERVQLLIDNWKSLFSTLLDREPHPALN